MALQIPDSMDELVYWTKRALDSGNVIMWVKKGDCPKCKKIKIGKPVGDNGKVKMRAKEYVCAGCGNTVEKEAYEESLTAEVIYMCPSCGKKGEFTGPFKRKNVQGIQTFRFQCGSCNSPIDVTKKMKEK